MSHVTVCVMCLCVCNVFMCVQGSALQMCQGTHVSDSHRRMTPT